MYSVNYFINPSDIGSYITRTTGSKSNDNPNSAAALNVVLKANPNPRQHFTSSNSPSLSKAERKALNSLYRSLDSKVESHLHERLIDQCQDEQNERHRLAREASGFFQHR